MGVPIITNGQALVAGVTTLILGAGNYIMESQSLAVIGVTAVAAGRVAGSLFLANAALTHIYMLIAIEGNAAAAGIVPIGQSRFASNVIWQRGDSVNVLWQNVANTNAASVEFNFYGINAL